VLADRRLAMRITAMKSAGFWMWTWTLLAGIR